ncbi:hypothetical protein F5876DRAFT_31562 [Lentinula aff. lateritia]|uniref:Uncharacterized protein n=1 Tax=Lentinula aff. lateritia TaxID=2804960 RepID=A0ACC1UD64_9AGAR|nr:hypothetical protein F5876DRAFT_31562 [Lentinula aff. lateritia]
MSASTIARWNAVSLTRSNEPTPLKVLDCQSTRKRDEDSDDDVSIVSRSPSPDSDVIDVDQDNINKYDEYVRRPAREVITVETPLKASNKGFAMLAKLGWVEGQPLGISGEGRVDPIPFQMKADSTGLGKVRQDVEMIETTVSQRRELDSERQQKETEDQRRAREVCRFLLIHTDAVARKSAVAEEISDVLKAFYCSLCDKQFKNVAQYDEHTNSYAHHHKARFKDMQASSRIKPQEEIEKRKEKEQKREEKQLRKIAAASGVKMAKTTLPPSGAPVLAPVANGSSGFQPSGWASVSGSGDSTLSSSSGGFKKAGWASVGPSSSPETLAPVSGVTTTSSGAPPAAASSGSWTVVTSSSGSSLDASSLPANVPILSASPVEPISQPAPQHPPSKSHLSRVGWQQFQKKNKKV